MNARPARSIRYHPSVISAGRPSNVPKMQDALGPEIRPTWYVPEGQGEAYEAYGARAVRELPGTLVEARNAALEDAFAQDVACLQLDDDFERVQVMERPEDVRPKPSSLPEAIEILSTELFRSGAAQLAGAASTDNAYFVRRAVSRRHFVIASFILVAPSEPRFDPGFRLKEDYDFTAQHIARYGEVCRVDKVLPTFRHYTNRGGCQLYRDPAAEAEAVQRLMDKWPGVFHHHPRRDGEVLMRWPEATRGGRRKA